MEKPAVPEFRVKCCSRFWGYPCPQSLDRRLFGNHPIPEGWLNDLHQSTPTPSSSARNPTILAPHASRERSGNHDIWTFLLRRTACSHMRRSDDRYRYGHVPMFTKCILRTIYRYLQLLAPQKSAKKKYSELHINTQPTYYSLRPIPKPSPGK